MEKFAPEFHGEDANNRATKFLESIKGKFTSPKDPKKKDSIISVNSIDIEVTKESPITSNSTIINPINETDDTVGNKPNYQRKPLVSFKEDPTPSDNPFQNYTKKP